MTHIVRVDPTGCEPTIETGRLPDRIELAAKGIIGFSFFFLALAAALAPAGDMNTWGTVGAVLGAIFALFIALKGGSHKCSKR